MGNTIGRQAANVAARTNVAAKKIPLSDRDAAEEFAVIARGYSSAQLGRAARRTKAAAKGWLDGSRAPGCASLLNMASDLGGPIRDWVARRAGIELNAAAPSLSDRMQEIAREAVREAMSEQQPALARDEAPMWDPRYAVKDLFAGKH